MNIEIIGCLFISIMSTIFVFDLQNWLLRKLESKPKKTYLEIWIEEYEKDVPTVWSNNEM